MRRRISCLALLVAISISLVACNKDNLHKNNNIETGSKGLVKEETNTKLLLDREVTEVIISKSEGSQTTVIGFTGTLKDDEDIRIFKDIISSAIEEEGKVKMPNPEFDLEIIYKDDSKQKLYLWIGKDGQRSSLMKTEKTETRYTISGEATSELIDLMK